MHFKKCRAYVIMYLLQKHIRQIGPSTNVGESCCAGIFNTVPFLHRAPAPNTVQNSWCACGFLIRMKYGAGKVVLDAHTVREQQEADRLASLAAEEAGVGG